MKCDSGSGLVPEPSHSFIARILSSHKMVRLNDVVTVSDMEIFSFTLTCSWPC